VTLIFQLSQRKKSLPFAPVEKEMPQVHSLPQQTLEIFSKALILRLLWGGYPVFGVWEKGSWGGGVLFLFIFIFIFCFCGIFGGRVLGPGEGG
jgi:hypothetical protein